MLTSNNNVVVTNPGGGGDDSIPSHHHHHHPPSTATPVAGRAPGQLSTHLQSRASTLDPGLSSIVAAQHGLGPEAPPAGGPPVATTTTTAPTSSTVTTNANSSSGAMLSPNVSVRTVNGRPTTITTIRAVSGNAANTSSIIGSNLTTSTTLGPGSFNSAIPVRSLISAPLSSTVNTTSPMTGDARNGQLESLEKRLAIERKIQAGAENLLLVLASKQPKDAKKARAEAERALNEANVKIDQLTSQVDILNSRNMKQQTESRSRMASKFRGEPLLPVPQGTGTPIGATIGEESLSTESPTWSLSDILQSLEEKGQRSEVYVEKANTLVHLLKRHQTLKYDLEWHAFGRRVQFMLTHESREVVSAGYRVARYAIADVRSLQNIKGLNTDIIVINSLAKDHTSSDARCNVEREQALKFIRAFLEIPGGIKEISRGVARALVSCAEQSDDRLRAMCIETLAEILILEPSLAVAAGAVRVLAQVLVDGPAELSDCIVIAFLYLLDMPSTRQYIRPGHDLEIVFSAFTDSYAKAHINEDRLRSCARIISSIFKSWPGVLALSMYDLRSVKSLVESLKIPHVAVREIILELLFDIFRIKPPTWSSTFLAGRRLTTYGRVANMKVFEPTLALTEDKEKVNLVDHFSALLLSIFSEAGLLDCLLIILEEEDGDLAIVRRSTLLVGEILKLSNRLLPRDINTRLQMLPSLFRCASQFDGTVRKTATSAVYQIDSLNRTLQRTGNSGNANTSRPSLEDPKASARQVEQVKLKLNLQIDEPHFRSLILDSQILTTKNHAKWKMDALLELVQGSLLNPKRLDEALKGTKFLKRLMSFFRPFKYRFSEIKSTKPNLRLVRLGCALFHTLLQNPEGIKYLADHKVLRQIAECLAQLDPMSGITSAEPLFSKARLQDTLCSGYFLFLGVLSTDPHGIAMMERWKMFNMFYHISELRSRDDLMFYFISAMDFTTDGHPRIILSKALTTGPRSVRLFATNHLRSLVEGCRRPPPNPLMPINIASTIPAETSQWAIRLLVTQLYDPDVEVCKTAVKILEEACNARASLEYVVQCRPALDHLGEIGAPLLLRFLSTSVGYHYLNELDYINREMDDWFHGRNDVYVDQVEASLARAFADNDKFSNSQEGASFLDAESVGYVPPHFYRELAKTAEGCRLLQEKGHFEEFAMFIAENVDEYEDLEIVTKVKGSLWAIGNIGSLPSGAPFLENSDIVEKIIYIAETSQVLSLKGTAFFVLGMLSRTSPGLELLDALGWDAKVTDMGEFLGYCLPKKLNKLLSLGNWEFTSGETKLNGRVASLTAIGIDESLIQKVLTAMTNLSNHILANEASRELVKLKQNYTELFQSPDIYWEVLRILESYRYRLPVRRFILELFERKCVDAVVKAPVRSVEFDDATPITAIPASPPRFSFSQ
ncbi:hypothetical protein H072_5728 [Dactylellina haptotyla CBS 200.50]|uniref:REM-1 domain-containing protein n=1 Tax=Dactylellina haptotyla (strain CBS 200.50) TaxID=1284197 RepID=S8AC10_DACHA|nr:hypothetical protein H072_5728 [Dactylellina haptotyla CBS 200.50]